MKKHILFLTLLFILASTNLTQAQTKEETIFWFNEYGFNMLTYTSPISSKFSYEYKIDENSIWFIKYQSNNQGIRSKSSEIKINYECFKEVYLENIYIGKYFGDLSLIIKFKNECRDYTEYSDGKIVVTGSDQIFYLYFDDKTTKEDQERFLKAFKHLAQLCGAKEKPKVKKNTF